LDILGTDKKSGLLRNLFGGGGVSAHVDALVAS
jgi:hypothetical protein